MVAWCLACARWGCGRREPEGSGLAARRRFREGRRRPRGCLSGPWPGRRAWRAGWAASSWCQVRSAGRGPGRAGWQAWELRGGASPSLGPWDRARRPAPGREPLPAMLPLGRSWVDHPPPQPAAGSRLSDRKLKRGSGTDVNSAPPPSEVLTETRFSEHPAVAVRTLETPQPQPSFLSPVLCSASSPSPHLPLHLSTP